MGLTQRPDSDYVKFRVIESEDGKSLVLASGVHTPLNCGSGIIRFERKT